MRYKCKKLFNGFASVRGTTIDTCIRNNEDLAIEYDGDIMFVPYEELVSPTKFQIHRREFKSKFNSGQKYELYDFYFKPDKNRQSKLDDFFK